MMILNGFVRYAEQTLREKDSVSYVCHMEGFGISQLFQGIAPLDPHLYTIYIGMVIVI